MNKKLIFIIMIVVIILGIIGYFIFFNNKNEEKVECMSFVGGSFTLKINKNNNESVEEISICIACSPSSYEKIEDPVYEGYKFLGWYYDSEFTQKAEFDTTLDIEPIQEYDENGCMTGYKTQEIYAKWEKE